MGLEVIIKMDNVASGLKSNKFWILILGGIVAVSAFVTTLLWNVPADYAKIYHDNRLTETVNLFAVTEPIFISIETQETFHSSQGEMKNSRPPVFDGVINIIAIEHGRVRMFMADCPDGLCVRQGWIDSGMIPIVCLPNRVVIILESAENEQNIDAVVG